jgi:hypothetical protein
MENILLYRWKILSYIDGKYSPVEVENILLYRWKIFSYRDGNTLL